jgi:hypothetical protein
MQQMLSVEPLVTGVYVGDLTVTSPERVSPRQLNTVAAIDALGFVLFCLRFGLLRNWAGGTKIRYLAQRVKPKRRPESDCDPNGNIENRRSEKSWHPAPPSIFRSRLTMLGQQVLLLGLEPQSMLIQSKQFRELR